MSGYHGMLVLPMCEFCLSLYWFSGKFCCVAGVSVTEIIELLWSFSFAEQLFKCIEGKREKERR